MKGAQRLAMAFLGAGLLLGSAGASAQDASPDPSNTPATDAIGPPQLQNFSLQGTVTRAADQPPQRAATPEPAATPQPAASRAAPARAEARRAEAPKPELSTPAPAARQAAALPQQLQQLTPAPAPIAATPAPTPPSAFPSAAETPTSTLAAEHGFPLLPWLLAAVALGAGGAFLFLRSRQRAGLVGGPHLDLFVAPEPEPAPPPAPAPRPAPPPPRGAEQPAPPAPPIGIVASGLRPWIDIAVQPLRCVLTDTEVTIEFELELLNSGGAPARSISIEVIILNAGANQNEELAAFFSHPPLPGDRIDVIRPVHRTNFATQVVLPRDHVVPVEMGGRQLFVPLLAFNAIYESGSSQGQTSVSFLVGRDGNGEKLAPFRLDLGPRIFRSLGARQLPTGVRR